MKRYVRVGVLAVLILALGTGLVFSQASLAGLPENQQVGGQSDMNLSGATARAVLAMAIDDYPATPGDVYTLVYLKGAQPDTLNLVVEGDGSINAGFLGKFATRNMSFRQVKSLIEKKVSDSYPGSNASVIIASTGLFPVTVRGEVTRAGQATAWGLSRLSGILTGFLMDYSGFRDVTVVSSDGSARTYDLYKAGRAGDFGQDPYVRPGDVVEVKRAVRIVSLEGEVRRPGKYQLLAGEGVAELVAQYGDGALESAKTELTVVTRRATAEKPESESLVFDLGGSQMPLLSDGDLVRVPSREEYLPVIYVEGAVTGAEVGVKKEAQQGNANAVVTEQYRVVRLAFRQGELLSQAVRGIRDQIDPRADLARAFITRKGETGPIAVDLEKLLYRYETADDRALKPEDKIVIPYGSMYAFVTGEVTKSSWVGITGLTRLSEATKPLVTQYSSLRDVNVRSEDGSEVAYDLFKAERAGDLTQDPYLRPGDVVEVKRAARIVSLGGEVRRPGKYQLLEGEGVAELVAQYGDGALESAKTDFSVVTRRATAEKPESESLVFDLGGSQMPLLSDGDLVRVPSREEYLPIIYVEGAVAGEQLAIADRGQALQPTSYAVIRAVYRKGISLSSLLRPMREKILPSANLKQAFIIRKGDTGQLVVDLERLLYANDASQDYPLEPNDRLVIPYGSMYVFVTGEVTKSSWVGITGLTRLSDAVLPLVTRYSSVRDIKVTGSDGTGTTYDLFKAERAGDLTQDPYLRPGDAVEVKRATRIVSLEGEVRKPGKYQLLEGEGVAELVRQYGDGALESAKTDFSVVTRRATAEKPESESLVFDLGGSQMPLLSDGDLVRVPSREEYLPVIYVEGAIVADARQVQAKTATQAGPAEPEKESYGLVRIAYRQGQLLSQVVKQVQAQLFPTADLAHAYVMRSGTRIAVNLEKLLYSYAPADDIALASDDRIVVPSGLNFVFVKGEVLKSVQIEVSSLTRLSQAVKGNLTELSSLRDIVVTSTDGSIGTYDLYKAGRAGDFGQDPYVRPRDVVEVKRAVRIVSLEGEVRRPGKYQLLAGEGVAELVAQYGDGALESAKTDLSVVTRRATTEKPESESLVFDLGGTELPTLADGDLVRVPSREEYLPVIYVEGAVTGAEVGVKKEAQQGNANAVVTEQYRVVRLAFRQGELLSQAVRGIRDQIDPRADLARAFITRKGETGPIAVDLEKLLYRYEAADDRALKAEDKIVIPYGSMYAFVTGEVTKSSWVGITGLTRLSEATKPIATQYSSLRDVNVKSEDGSETAYDLFKAERGGDLTQDPYLRPGDIVEVKKAARIVSLEGEVRKPGKYQLLAGEGVAELVAHYGDGALESAKTDFSVVTRRATAEKPESESLVFDLGGKDLPSLADGDLVRVPSREEYLPVIYVEGAVAGEQLAIADRGQAVQPTSYAVIRAVYRKGISLSSLLRPMREKILPSANLKQAFIIRKGDTRQIVVDLERLLYANDASQDYPLEPNDRLVIPYGSMYVFVTGEVTKSSWVGITGLTRLSDAVLPLVTRYSSVRDIKVTGSDGTGTTYDLFKAERAGDLTQDPYLRTGDEIRVAPLSIMVTIQGEVKRPGIYQLLPGEGLKELLNEYAGGFTERANIARLTLLRYVSEKNPVGEKLQFDYGKQPDTPIKLYDVITVPSMQDLIPVVWFEGAVGLGATGTSPETSQRIAYTFIPGETISQAALTNRKLFSAVSDISKAFLLRADGTRVAFDLGKFIYNYDISGDIELMPNDTIIVPFRQFFVTVSGAVKNPGRYPYIPERTWKYYVGLAGGFDTDRNSGQKITIFDSESNEVASAERKIEPEDNIEAAANSFLYGFSRVASIFTTAISILALVISLLP